MTAIATQETAPDTARTKKAAAVKIALSGEPTVQLLPPSVRDRAAIRSRIRTGVLFVVLGIVVAVGLFIFGTFRATQAQMALLEANTRTADLLLEQGKYTDATRINSLIAQIEELQKGATVTEVSWSKTLQELLVRLPAGAEISTVSFVGVVPWEKVPSGAAGSGELIATIEFSVFTTTIPEATAYARSLASMPGYFASTISPIAVGTDGRVASTISLGLTWDAWSGRFDESKDEDAAASETESADENAADEPADGSADEQTED